MIVFEFKIRFCRKARFTLEVWVLTLFVIAAVLGVKNWQVKQDFALLGGFENL